MRFCDTKDHMSLLLLTEKSCLSTDVVALSRHHRDIENAMSWVNSSVATLARYDLILMLC